MSGSVQVRAANDGDVEALGELAARASAEAQSPALNEQTLLSLRGSAGSAASGSAASGPMLLLAEADGAAVAALAVHTADSPVTAELVLPAGAHLDGAADALLTELESIARARTADGAPVWLWTHGRLSPAGRIAAARGYRVNRELYRLIRPGDQPEPAAPVPAGVRIAAFRPGADDAPWLAVNAAAFAQHAEQGQWTQADLQARIDSEWFDPAGFFLAWGRPAAADGAAASSDSADEVLLGFHWTKLEADPRHDGRDSGEVYVIGVDPRAASMHLGSALLSIGLRHLRERGVPAVYLYVDGDNTRARALYAHVGFSDDDVDLCFDVL
jgi:mycothiol synthase